ncbi:MAG: cysteine desulfurase family protein [Actinomycetota bacterium]|nr:cysteine desulfurase family protein [Actinomycetota bacterium]
MRRVGHLPEPAAEVRLAYMDHAATSPPRPEAIEAMMPHLGRWFGNPSGSHSVARQAKAALDSARDRIAEVLGVSPLRVVFTSGGTEADNLAVLGAARKGTGPVVCPASEHHAVLEPVRASGGVTVAVDGNGVVDLAALEEAVRDGAALVSVMAVNNETGALSPLREVADLVRRRAPGALLHTDAVQAAPTFDLAELAAGFDMVSVASHKLGGPKGVGVLVTGSEHLPLVLHGGAQEGGRRPGTQDVAGAVGMATALEASARHRAAERSRVGRLRDVLSERIRASVPAAVETCADVPRAPGHLHMRFPGMEAEEILFLLDEKGVCASSGSACASGASRPSHVLSAMGIPEAEVRSAVRFSLGWTTTADDVEQTAEAVAAAVGQLLAAGSRACV